MKIFSSVKLKFQTFDISEDKDRIAVNCHTYDGFRLVCYGNLALNCKNFVKLRKDDKIKMKNVIIKSNELYYLCLTSKSEVSCKYFGLKYPILSPTSKIHDEKVVTMPHDSKKKKLVAVDSTNFEENEKFHSEVVRCKTVEIFRTSVISTKVLPHTPDPEIKKVNEIWIKKTQVQVDYPNVGPKVDKLTTHETINASEFQPDYEFSFQDSEHW